MSVFKPFAFKSKFFGIVSGVAEDHVVLAGKDGEMKIEKSTIASTVEEGQTIHLELKDEKWELIKVETKPTKTRSGNPVFTADQQRAFDKYNY